MAITHTTLVTVPDDGTSPVGSDEWNAAHTVGDGTVTMAMLEDGLQVKLHSLSLPASLSGSPRGRFLSKIGKADQFSLRRFP